MHLITKWLVLATLMLAFPASAQAHTVFIGPGQEAHESAVACAAIYSPKVYRSYASKVYRRDHVSKRAHARLAMLHICQPSFKARVAVGKIHTRLYRARQARIAAAIAARRRAAQQTQGGAGGILAAIRSCESGGNYAANTGNGFYGAYQFTVQTWIVYGGTGMPNTASPGEQDRIAARLLAAHGVHTSASWPNCP